CRRRGHDRRRIKHAGRQAVADDGEHPAGFQLIQVETLLIGSHHGSFPPYTGAVTRRGGIVPRFEWTTAYSARTGRIGGLISTGSPVRSRVPSSLSKLSRAKAFTLSAPI